MSIRVVHLEDGAVQSSDATTYTLTLPQSGFLHALLVTVSCTNGATSGRAVSPLDIADSIRVMVKGDQRAFDLNVTEIEKYHETFMGYPLQMHWDEQAAAVQSVVFPVMFGRVLEDMEYFLPCSKVGKPRLEIPYSPTIAADGGFATGTVTIDVIGLWSPEEDKLPYKGTLITQTIDNYTSAASGDTKTDINTKDPIRAIGVYAYEAGVEDGSNITAVRLRANSGAFDPVKCDWPNLIDVSRQRHWAEISHACKAFLQDTETLKTRLGHIDDVRVNPYIDDNLASNLFYLRHVYAIAGDTLTLACTVGDITAGAEDLTSDTTDRLTQIAVKGDSPSYFGTMEWTGLDGGQGYLMPDEFDDLAVILTNGNAGGQVYVSTQTLHQFV